MLKQNTKSKESGFTIIEVMIVLAIAGLIMLIVFLAVPALQRNSRNTQAKNEASNMVGAVSEYVSNNNGRLPANGTSATPGSNAEDILRGSNVKNITTLLVESTNASSATATQAVLKKGFKCGTASITAGFGTGGVVAGSSRQFALIYPMENRSGDATGCIDS